MTTYRTPSDYRDRRRRHFEPATAAIGREGIGPYDLRHSFASLMIQAGYLDDRRAWADTAVEERRAGQRVPRSLGPRAS